jgi:hypothetical protein
LCHIFDQCCHFFRNVSIILEYSHPPTSPSKSFHAQLPLQIPESKLPNRTQQSLALLRAIDLVDPAQTGFISHADFVQVIHALGLDPDCPELGEFLGSQYLGESTPRIDTRAFVTWYFQKMEAHHLQPARFFVCLSLSDAETVRKLLHERHPALTPSLGGASIALWSIRGRPTVLDASEGYVPGPADVRLQVLQSFRFLNNDMHYHGAEFGALLRGLAAASPTNRKNFFEHTLTHRRRDHKVPLIYSGCLLSLFAPHFIIICNFIDLLWLQFSVHYMRPLGMGKVSNTPCVFNKRRI